MMNPISPGESWLKDLIFCIFHVGIIEEAVKQIPVMSLVLLLGERINNPLDLVIYGGISALVFASMENSLYFSDIWIKDYFPPLHLVNRFTHGFYNALLLSLGQSAVYKLSP
jgi:RsiW-degrading membrane proteinase PrsW (M82 family)